MFFGIIMDNLSENKDNFKMAGSILVRKLFEIVSAFLRNKTTTKTLLVRQHPSQGWSAERDTESYLNTGIVTLLQ